MPGAAEKKNKIRATTPRNPGEMEFIKCAGCDGDVIPALSEEGSVLEELLLRCFKEGEWVSLRGQVQGERERESTRNIARNKDPIKGGDTTGSSE